MILLKIVTSEEDDIYNVAEYLLENKLAVDISIKKNVNRIDYNEGRLIESNLFLLTAKTKALLFNDIEDKLISQFKNKIAELYALPIVAMEKFQTENLIKFIKQV